MCTAQIERSKQCMSLKTRHEAQLAALMQTSSYWQSFREPRLGAQRLSNGEAAVMAMQKQ